MFLGSVESAVGADKNSVVESGFSIVGLEQTFSENAMLAHTKLRQWKNNDYSSFLEQAITVLRSGHDNAFTHLVLQMCHEDGASLHQILFTADLLNLDEAARLVRLASKTDPAFQVHLVASVKAEIDKAGSSVRSEDLTRLLEMLVHAVDANRLVPMLAKLCEHSDERIRSKAVLLTGRVARRLPKGVELLNDLDPRVRANAVEALWKRRDRESVEFFKEASKDPHHRVAANALLGLYWAGELAAVHGIAKMATDLDVGRQLAGIWLMGQAKDPRFTNVIQGNLATSTGRQKFALLKAGRLIKQRRDEVQNLPGLKLEIVRVERTAGGRVRIAFLAFSDDGAMLGPESLLATNAVIHEGELRIDHFRWDASGADSVHAAFLIPMRTGVGENFATQLVSAMELGISGKRRADHWAIQKYELKGGEAANMAPVEFLTANEVLRSEQLRAARGAAAGLAEGIERLIPLFPAEAKHKHVVIVLDPDLDPGFEVAKGWGERFSRYGVVPHVVSCGELSAESVAAWQKFCTDRQGIFLECDHVSELPLALRRLCLGLQCNFELSYQLGRSLPSESGPQPVTLEIYSDAGYAKVTVTGDGTVSLAPSKLKA